MKRTYLIIGIFIIIFAMAVGIYTLNNKSKNIASQNIVKDEINEVSEKVTDECIDEWEGIEDDVQTQMIETNSSATKISPNCLITLKKYYSKCGHTINEYIDIPEELVNKTEEELKQRYEGWEVKSFSSTDIILCKEFEGECQQHYVLREQEGKIVIFIINANGEEELYERTEISVDYLSDVDKESVMLGIKVYGEEALNQLIEDFE